MKILPHKNKIIITVVILILGSMLLFVSIFRQKGKTSHSVSTIVGTDKEYVPEVTKTETEWKTFLTSKQYAVLRNKGTEVPYSNKEILNEKRKGTYVTADCNEPVFRSEQKYDSGTGWPSFYAPIQPDAVILLEDNEYGVKRIEVVGKKCGGHLGHVFDDGPQPTGKRYCINGVALKFIPDET